MNKVIIPSLLLFTVFSGSGLFLGTGLSSPFLVPWIAAYLLLLFAVAYRSLFTDKAPLSFEFIILGIIGLNTAVQISGGINSPFHAAYFLAAIAGLFQPPIRVYIIGALSC